jgi:uncharacterized protein
MTRSPLSPTPRTTLGRSPDRATSDRTALDAVLDVGLTCHLGVLPTGHTAPMVLPTGYGRDGDTLYLHGSTGATSLRAAASGVPVCVTVTLVDGVVYARSVFHFSMNYRSAVVYGQAKAVTDPAAKSHGLRVITEHLAPGSWSHAREPNKKELAATSVLALDLTEASVKVRGGPPKDDEADVAAGVAWAGVLPLHQRWGQPEPCPLLPSDAEIPEHVTARPQPGIAKPAKEI